jgi:hypothetical protein
MNSSTLAPSEKHLEDWIVANQNRFAAYAGDGLVEVIKKWAAMRPIIKGSAHEW